MAGSNAPVGDDSSLPISDEDFSSGRTAIRIASVAALGGLLFGYDSAVINGAVDSIQEDFGIGNAKLGFAVASALLGAAVGAMPAGRIADKIGRISVMKIAAVALPRQCDRHRAGAQCVDWWSLFRVVGGIGVGVASVIAPAYIAETSPPGIRGRLGSLQQLAIVSGIFVSFAVNWLLQHIAGGPNEPLWLGLEAWRWMFMVMAIPALLYGGAGVHHSRVTAVSRCQPQDSGSAPGADHAARARRTSRSRSTASGSPWNARTSRRWTDLRKPTGGIYGIVWVGLGLSVFQQFVGINVIFYYSNVLWQAVGFSADESAVIHRDHVGDQRADHADRDRADRQDRPQAAAAHRLVRHGGHADHDGGHLRQRARSTRRQAAACPARPGVIALIAANLFVVAFGMSWGPVVWVLLGEMFPNRIRAAALGLAAAGQWAANWLITVTFPGLREHLGPRLRLLRAVRGAVRPLRLAVGRWRPRACRWRTCTASIVHHDEADSQRPDGPSAKPAVTARSPTWNNRVP